MLIDSHGVSQIMNLKQAEALIKTRSWYNISRTFGLPENFIEKYKNKVDWHWISAHQKLSERFISKHSDKVDWETISSCQKLSERFISKNSDKVDWDWISMDQELSESFIKKHRDKVTWSFVLTNQKVSEKFLKEHYLFKDYEPSDGDFNFKVKPLTWGKYEKLKGKDLERVDDLIAKHEKISLYPRALTYTLSCSIFSNSFISSKYFPISADLLGYSCKNYFNLLEEKWEIKNIMRILDEKDNLAFRCEFKIGDKVVLGWNNKIEGIILEHESDQHVKIRITKDKSGDKREGDVYSLGGNFLRKKSKTKPVRNLKEAEKLIGEKCWNSISQIPGLPKSFISKYKNRVNWGYILRYQKLPESFISKYKV